MSGAAVDVAARLKEEYDMPLRSHGSLSLNRALMAASLVDRMQVTLFPVITGQTGWNRSSRVRPTSTWNCSRAGRSIATLKSSSTGPPCMPEPALHPRSVRQPGPDPEVSADRHAAGLMATPNHAACRSPPGSRSAGRDLTVNPTVCSGRIPAR